MILEMERICEKNHLQAIVRDSWTKIWGPKVFQQAQMEKYNNRRLRTQLEQHFSISDEGI